MLTDIQCFLTALVCPGRAGVASQPWLGSWNDNVTVELTGCPATLEQVPTEAGTLRWDGQRLHCIEMMENKMLI